MTFRSRPRRPPQGSRSGPPTWFVFLIGVALVFGVYYLWLGVQNYFQSGGLGIEESTQQAVIVASATAERIFEATAAATPRPTVTPIPECQDFVVTAPSAIVRETPTMRGAIVTSYSEGTVVCVLGRPEEGSEWYTIDTNEQSRRIELAYMHESIILAVNPTPTPSRTPTPSITPSPTLPPTITITPSPPPTATRVPGITNTPTPTASPTPTQSVQSA
jgi:hypothetical protein